MTKIITPTTSLEPVMRTLRSDELDVVTGGIINGCIRLPTLVLRMPKEPQPYVDQFASRLPSWVHPL